mgnify:CR=1 FL=1
MGVLSRYPVMDGLDDQRGWGLAWQSMPFALWSEAGDWGFLQWEARDEGGGTAHPALTRWKAKVKSLGTQPPFGKGETFERPWQGGFLVFRRLAEIPPSWNALVGRLRLYPGTGAEIHGIGDEHGWKVSLGGVATSLYIACLPLRGAPEEGTLVTEDDCRLLDHAADLDADGGYAALWWIGESPLKLEREDDGGGTVARILAGGESLAIAMDDPAPFG